MIGALAQGSNLAQASQASYVGVPWTLLGLDLGIFGYRN